MMCLCTLAILFFFCPFAICWRKVPRLSCETSSSPSFRAPASRVRLRLGRKPSCHEKREVLILVFRMTLDILHFYDILRWPMISFLFGRLVFCKCQSHCKYDYNKSLTMFGLSPLNWRCRMERRKHLWMSRHFCSPTCDDLTCTDSWRLGTIRDYSWLMTNVNLMRLLVTPWPWNNGASSNRDGSMARELRRLKPWLTKNARNKAWYYRYLSILWCYFCWNRWVLRKCNRCNMHQDTETVIICDFSDIFRLND